MRGIYYSSNNADAWVDKSSWLGDNHHVSYFTSFTMGADGTLYVGTSGGVCRSTDGGDTWLLPSNYDDVYIRGVTISGDGSIFATTVREGVLKSTDSGDTWTQVNNGLPIEDTYKIIYNPITNDIFVSTSYISDSKYHYGVYRSTNLGVSWELTNAGLLANDLISGFAVNHNTGQMFASGFDGVYRSRR